MCQDFRQFQRTIPLYPMRKSENWKLRTYLTLRTQWLRRKPLRNWRFVYILQVLTNVVYVLDSWWSDKNQNGKFLNVYVDTVSTVRRCSGCSVWHVNQRYPLTRQSALTFFAGVKVEPHRYGSARYLGNYPLTYKDDKVQDSIPKYEFGDSQHRNIGNNSLGKTVVPVAKWEWTYNVYHPDIPRIAWQKICNGDSNSQRAHGKTTAWTNCFRACHIIDEMLNAGEKVSGKQMVKM